jgi:hypothetical protein
MAKKVEIIFHHKPARSVESTSGLVHPSYCISDIRIYDLSEPVCGPGQSFLSWR